MPAGNEAARISVFRASGVRRGRGGKGWKAKQGEAFGGVGELSEVKKLVDAMLKLLHNLASLLLKQQRKTAGPAGTVLKVERRDL